jgi:prophage regulatory protein
MSKVTRVLERTAMPEELAEDRRRCLAAREHGCFLSVSRPIYTGPQLLRLPAVAEITGLAPSTVYAAIAAGKFPASIPLWGSARGWVASEVAAWVEARIAEARGQ